MVQTGSNTPRRITETVSVKGISANVYEVNVDDF
jgi:hypothetical protein